jgi:hypothetical protein
MNIYQSIGATIAMMVALGASTPDGARAARSAVVPDGDATTPATLANNFVTPPDSCRPWVYAFFLNGNITRGGITADLEAMKRAGIGGMLVMEVDQGTPGGPVDFMSDEEMKETTKALWGTTAPAPAGERKVGKGLVVWGKTVAEVLAAMGVARDFVSSRPMRYIHRDLAGKDVYFVANPVPQSVEALCTFRVSGKQPELWDPVTGEQRDLPEGNDGNSPNAEGATKIATSLAEAINPLLKPLLSDPSKK